MLVAVVNHNMNRHAGELAAGFAPLVPVVTIDSGSRLASGEREIFDIILPNVHYSGLLNEAGAQAQARQETVLYFVCSDVEFDDYSFAISCAKEAFADRSVAVYAPSVNASSHASMLNKRSGGVRSVCFVEGFCFASRVSALREMTPVDLAVNRIGWGLDVYLGYLAMKRGRRSVVDDRVLVRHPVPSGYSKSEARSQRDRWFDLQSPAARRFRLLTGNRLSHSRYAPGILKCLRW